MLPGIALAPQTMVSGRDSSLAGPQMLAKPGRASRQIGLPPLGKIDSNGLHRVVDRERNPSRRCGRHDFLQRRLEAERLEIRQMSLDVRRGWEVGVRARIEW